MAYVAVFIHEFVHFLAAYACNIRSFGVEVDIFGIRLKTPYVLNSSERIIICASGPLASLVIFILFEIISSAFPAESGACGYFAFVNFCIGIINILPISPLDGGAIIKALLAKRLGVILGGRVYRSMSAYFCVIFIIFVLWTAFIGIFSPALALPAVFLVMGIKQEFLVALNEKNIILSEANPKSHRLRYIAYDGDTPVLTAVSRISADYTLHTAVFSEGRFIGELSQNELVFAVKKHGALTELKDCIEKNKNL